MTTWKKSLCTMVCVILALAVQVSKASATEGSMPDAVIGADQSVVRVIAPLGDLNNEVGSDSLS